MESRENPIDRRPTPDLNPDTTPLRDHLPERISPSPSEDWRHASAPEELVALTGVQDIEKAIVATETSTAEPAPAYPRFPSRDSLNLGMEDDTAGGAMLRTEGEEGMSSPSSIDPPSAKTAPVAEERTDDFEGGLRTTVEPFIIGIAGASASGKTTVCEKIIHGLGDHRCVLVSLDWFYHSIPDDVDCSEYNFDHPDAIDFNYLHSTLKMMQKGQPVEVPTYDFKTHRRTENVFLNAADVIIVEGILTFYPRYVRKMMHMKIFVDEDPDVCLCRRIRRDVDRRGRTLQGVLAQYEKFVKKSFDEFILPTKRHADLIVPRGGDNHVAINLIVQNIALKLKQEGDLRKLYPNLHVLRDVSQIRGLHTIFRSRDTSREDFVFYADRLIRLVVEKGLGLLPFERRVVVTPTDEPYFGVEFPQGIVGVSIIRSGEAMENALRGTVACATGELLRRGVRADRITILNLISSPEGIARICSDHPHVRLMEDP